LLQVEILVFAQRVQISFNLTGVNVLVVQTDAAQQQVRAAGGAWLGVQATNVTIASISTVSDGAAIVLNAVSINLIVSAAKDVSSHLAVASAAANLAAHLNAAVPRGITATIDRSTVSIADPVVDSAVSVRVELNEAEYEWHRPWTSRQASMSDLERFHEMSTFVVGILQDEGTIAARINAKSNCSRTACKSFVLALENQTTIERTMPVRDLDLATQSEVILVLTILLVLLAAFTLLCVALYVIGARRKKRGQTGKTAVSQLEASTATEIKHITGTEVAPFSTGDEQTEPRAVPVPPPRPRPRRLPGLDTGATQPPISPDDTGTGDVTTVSFLPGFAASPVESSAASTRRQSALDDRQSSATDVTPKPKRPPRRRKFRHSGNAQRLHSEIRTAEPLRGGAAT
jgi:hypothetical protein